ncbi:glucose-1-phosphate thymidylyltransferase [Streptomyces sp. NPDC058457]|uniref:glucose-1-phosphate thymidylyltransferase n=1 Tax=Streptomyces sp. NPDC058457 TaxID=3346507 RepID=UPI00365C63B7
MKALVLAGGMGTRLRPFSDSTAKQLVPVANKPVLLYGLEAIAAAGITEVGIVVGDRGAEIRAAVGDGARLGLRVSYLHQDRPAGLAHGVLIARDFLGDDDFVMYLGDNVFTDGIGDLVARFLAGGCASVLLLAKVEDTSEYGIAVVDGQGRVRGLVEKPEWSVSDLAVTGAYAFSPAVHEAVRAIRPSARGELEITDAVRWLVDNGHPVRAEMCTGYWCDTGRIDDWLDCDRTILDTVERDVRGQVDAESVLTGQIVVDPTAQVVRSRVTGPVVVGAGATLRDADVGPHLSVGPHCLVERSAVARSVLLERSTVSGVRGLTDSIIGRGAEVRGTRSTATLILGDAGTATVTG